MGFAPAAVMQEEVTDKKIECEKELAKAEAALSETLNILNKVMTYFYSKLFKSQM